MSVEHVKREYQRVADLYFEMLENLKDFEELAMNHMYDMDRLDKIKEEIAPLKRNYEMWSYVMFLLSQRKDGTGGVKKHLKNCNGMDAKQIEKECEDTLKRLDSMKDDIVNNDSNDSDSD